MERRIRYNSEWSVESIRFFCCFYLSACSRIILRENKNYFVALLRSSFRYLHHLHARFARRSSEAYLEYFEQSWSKLANTLYIEAPVGVGFSYSTAGATDYNCTDDSTADDNLAALHSFYEKFPQFVKNDLFITGESYAGVYVPTLAEV